MQIRCVKTLNKMDLEHECMSISQSTCRGINDRINISLFYSYCFLKNNPCFILMYCRAFIKNLPPKVFLTMLSDCFLTMYNN